MTTPRRDFIKTASFAAAALPLGAMTVRGELAGTERLRLGLIGSGERGAGAVADALAADPAVECVAIGDLFADRLDAVPGIIRSRLERTFQGDAAKVEEALKRFKVTPDRKFSGWDNHKQVVNAGVDVVLMAAPPVFRPDHLEAALAAGKHVFMEKPVCVDPVGARRMFELAKVADAKKLSVVAGTQRRHQTIYVEAMKRLHGGQIGRILGGQATWYSNGYPGLRVKNPNNVAPEEMEYQTRNWLLFRWASGDHIVEQHVHNLDVMNWGLRGLPVSCTGMGGRQLDLEFPKMGDRYDHFGVEYVYDDDVRVASACRQSPGANHQIGERFVGTKGTLILGDTRARIVGEQPWEMGNANNPYVQEHIDLIASIRNGKPLNEVMDVTTSTLTAILGRTSAYTGRGLNYSWLVNKSELNLTPAKWEWTRKEITPAPIPGKTEPV
jgi:predicted dehydrogenase